MVFLGVSCAQEAIFDKSLLMRPSGAKTEPVDLIVSDTGVTIRTKDTAFPVILDLPYRSINSLGYTFGSSEKFVGGFGLWEFAK